MVPTRSAPAPAIAGGRPRRPAPLVPVLAVAGAGCVALQLGVYTAWLAAGPRQVTEYRDPASASWYAARFFEAVIVVVAVGMLVHVVRCCRRERRLTFDAMLCLAGAAAYWIDPIDNWLQPLFMYSSNWVNLSNWSGHVPLVVNPDAGRMPEPVLFIGLSYAFGFPLFIMVINAAMARLRRRWPNLGPATLVGLAVLAGAAVDVAFELPMFLLRTWAYPGTPDAGLFPHRATKFPLVEIVVAGVVFGGLAALRFFRDDRGRTVLERRAGALPGRWRAPATALALVAVTNGAFLTAGMVEMAVGLYAAPYRPMPAHLVNGLCGPGTRYGACPGSPGYRLPLRGDLRGPNP
ncbi:MAG TPA: spirocyclase AveC family protein [Acidimicrobiia bacterium]|nr:spirocyclase AveC family protein [Acidimicrobiia bacterium]